MSGGQGPIAPGVRWPMVGEDEAGLYRLVVMDARDHEVDDPSEVVDSLRSLHDRPGDESFVVRIFGTPTFFRLWLAQAVSSIGDWLGFPTADHGLGLGTAITSAIFRDPRYGRVPHAHPQRRDRRHELTLRAACGGGRR